MREEATDALEHRVRSRLAAGEDYNTEFKSDRKQLNDRDLVEVVVCLANGGGGVLIIDGRTRYACRRWLPARPRRPIGGEISSDVSLGYPVVTKKEVPW